MPDRSTKPKVTGSNPVGRVDVIPAGKRDCGVFPALPLDVLLERTAELNGALALLPLDRPLLEGAGALAEPALRALDAIHVASAVALDPVGAFVTYDERQAAAARLAGLGTMSPGT